MASADGNRGTFDRATVERIVRQVALEYLGRDSKGKAPELVVQASSRHMHVCREDMDVLFGPGTELTFDRPLFQEGNFAAKETVTIVGPRSRIISNLRILGPCASSRRWSWHLPTRSCLASTICRCGFRATSKARRAR